MRNFIFAQTITGSGPIRPSKKIDRTKKLVHFLQSRFNLPWLKFYLWKGNWALDSASSQL